MTKIKFLLSLFFAFFTVLFFKGTYTADFENRTISCVIDFAVPDIIHSPQIQNVIPVTDYLTDSGYLIPKVYIDFGCCTKVTKAEINYKLYDNSNNITEKTQVYNSPKLIKDNEKVYLDLKQDPEYCITSNYKKVEYKISALFDNYAGTIVKGPFTADISTSVTKDGNGTITLESGDQINNKDRNITVSYKDGETGTATLGYFDNTAIWNFFKGSNINSVKSLSAKKEEDSRKICYVDNVFYQNINPDAVYNTGVLNIDISYPADYTEEGYCFELWVLEDVFNYMTCEKKLLADTLGNNNEKCSLNVDPVNGTMEASFVTGYSDSPSTILLYLVKLETDTDCRPKRRAIIKGRSAGFEFAHLKDGDVLKIFNVNGKKVREINRRTTGFNGFIWDGRNDNGDWAKSGIYIYQIKLKGDLRSDKNKKVSDKLISGTIVFAK